MLKMEKLIVLIRSTIAYFIVYPIFSFFILFNFFIPSRGKYYKFYQKYMLALNKINRKLLAIICGFEVEYRGLENIKKGKFIVASKHQSAFETYMLFDEFFNNVYWVMKESIIKTFTIGNAIKKLKIVPINRKTIAVNAFVKACEDWFLDKEDAQLVLFPEGTRGDIYKKYKYKKGVFYVYENYKVPVIPVALTTGVCMPSKKYCMYSGKIIVEFLPPIEIGLGYDDFMGKLENTIENKTNELLAEIPENLLIRELKKVK
jgi:1-acyl-sn-glycerol-3-phosphate acyltransferase